MIFCLTCWRERSFSRVERTSFWYISATENVLAWSSEWSCRSNNKRDEKKLRHQTIDAAFYLKDILYVANGFGECVTVRGLLYSKRYAVQHQVPTAYWYTRARDYTSGQCYLRFSRSIPSAFRSIIRCITTDSESWIIWLNERDFQWSKRILQAFYASKRRGLSGPLWRELLERLGGAAATVGWQSKPMTNSDLQVSRLKQISALAHRIPAGFMLELSRR